MAQKGNNQPKKQQTNPMMGVTLGKQGAQINAVVPGAVEESEAYGDVPQARFGHTITLVSKNKVVLFGGATGDTGRYSMTGETFLFNFVDKHWQRLNGKYSSEKPFIITAWQNSDFFSREGSPSFSKGRA